MLSRLAIALSLAVAIAPAQAGERDYLRKGDRKLTQQWHIDFNRAVRTVLARGWRQDVVLRTFDLTAGSPEWVSGIARTGAGYRAFEVAASTELWAKLSDTSTGQMVIKHDYSGIRGLLHERPLSEALSVRIAALWRRMLTDPRNYGEEKRIYTDADVFAFDLRFARRERLIAHTSAWGPRTEQLVLITRALARYAKGAPESELTKAVSTAERKFGI
jgi:hypothetical protein